MGSQIGLRFKKCDLHVHTPASNDYQDKAVTPEQIVAAAMSAGLSAVAIADHQTGDWVDQIQKAAEGTDLAVFPGVELLVTGGEEGIHVVCIFDRNNSGAYVNQFLNRLKVYDKDGKRTLCTELSVGQVADELQDYDKNALLILAHCHSSKGVLSDVKGATRTAIFDKDRICLLGAEANESNFLDDDKRTKHKRVVDILDGSDINYANKKLGVYQSSDSHLPSTIGSKYSYFKVDDIITIEDIRQCLVDRDTRIRQPHEFEEGLFPTIQELQITGGFLDGQEFVFNPGLNSLLGSKGSGKSLVVEFLRFALGQAPTNIELAEDHHQKLAKCLGIYAKVKVVIKDDSGKTYVIERQFNPSDENPVVILDAIDSSEKHFDISQAFPVLFLSQNEVIKIAEDLSGKEQRQFIDRFFDFRSFVHESDRALHDLTEADRRFAEALRSHYKVQAVEKAKKTLNEELEKIERQLTNKAFAEYKKNEGIGQALNSQRSYLEGLRKYILDVKGQLADYTPSQSGDSVIANDPAVKRAFDNSALTHKQVLESLTGAVGQLDSGMKVLDAAIAEHGLVFKPIKQKYDELVKQAGGTEINLSQRRQQTVARINKLDKEIAALKGNAAQLKGLTERRKTIIAEVDANRKSYFQTRKERCDFFSTTSDGTLRVSIAESADTSDFSTNLLRFKRGSWLRDEEMQQIALAVEPSDFIRSVLGYEWAGRKRGTATRAIAEKSKLDEEKVAKLFDHLLDGFSYEDILALQYGSMPEDKPMIELKVGNDYKPLAELSVGQKSVALLIMALSDGTFPIVIDQPEDSLDLRSIWDDVCCKVRGSKEKRQFLFTTHNSSVAVASDSDSFTVLEADATRGKAVFSGSINKPDIRKQVIRYLEGGDDTYKHKRKKYNI